MGCNQVVQGEALPAQHLFELILGRPFRVVVHEDNEATITIVRKGYSPKLRAMQRTHKTNMEQLHELITEDVQNYNEDGDPSGPVVLQHHEGLTHKGDLFTKCLDPTKFQVGLKLLKVRRPELPPPLKKGKVIDFRPSNTGGNKKAVSVACDRPGGAAVRDCSGP